MQEFSTVAASAYDAEALTPLLNDKAADGWSVVSIVAAGPNVIAYLSRDTDGAPATATAADAGASTTATATAAEVAPAETPATSPVEEPAGWGAVAGATTSSPVDAGASPEAPAAETPAPAAAPEPEPAAAPASESTVPAGWYADPSGRFELRYWDGNQWTEHVSRDGQQYTDPPVA